MLWNSLHSTLLARAFQKVIGRPEAGTMAFVRCLMPDVILALATDPLFKPEGWQVYRVANQDDREARSITADHAVELRESKQEAILLLVDTTLAGAGMDGIYSAAREVDEASLFREALRLAYREVTKRLKRSTREYAEQAVKKARGFGQLYSISPWIEFDFVVRVADEQRHPGEILWLLGLWPIQPSGDSRDDKNALDLSRLFVDHLLGPALIGQTSTQRIESLRLLDPTEQQVIELERFLRSASTRALRTSLEKLAEKPELWVNSLKLEGTAHEIQGIDIIPWRTRAGKLAKWSGLNEGAEGQPPVLILDPNAEGTGNYSQLEIRWKARPENLEKGSVHYNVIIITDMDEPLTSREIPHSEKKEEKCRFTNDDFALLSDNALLSCKITISVIGNDTLETQESEEFIICFGNQPDHKSGGVGKVVRTFSDGLIELDDREAISAMDSHPDSVSAESRGYVVLRTQQRGKAYRVYRPALIREVEEDWIQRRGEPGRWRVKVRASGSRAGKPEFISLNNSESTSAVHDRVSSACRRMAERFSFLGGGVGQIYDQDAKSFEVVKEYLLAWAALLDQGNPEWALGNTVEIQSLSGRTIGLIVLPAHALRVAWHVAYDNLVLHTRFTHNMAPKQVRDELALLDGSMFPPFLPGLVSGKSFVFADMLGFHTVGMVADDDREPKAAIAILARALGESESADAVPTVGRQSAQVLGNEILKYIECHDTSPLLHIHALRPGDGLTVARSLGHVQKRVRRVTTEDEFSEDNQANTPSFVLELYPTEEQRGVAGRFIAEAREKRRSGAGVVLDDDKWMLESSYLTSGMTLPRLRWARKREVNPKTAAHLAVAFDTFESRVITEVLEDKDRYRPFYVYGLMSFFERSYASLPTPLWRSMVVDAVEGEKHPADRTHTERLLRIQQAIQTCVVRGLGTLNGGLPVLRTEISPEKAFSLRELHRLCDWVITLDRNAGIEYFDSPCDNRDVYDAYVIDCVPEREDLGCLQLITSTSNIDEVRNLLDEALDQMGLSRSRRNAEFLLEHLKALSGRLAIRLTGQKAPTAELIALAMCQANCRTASEDDVCWMSLRGGYFVPVDDIRDLLPPFAENNDKSHDHAIEDISIREDRATRPDLIYVTVIPRKGLRFRFSEVKYRRHLRSARSLEVLQSVRDQVESHRRRWDEWYATDTSCDSFRAVRRAKLARVLRFYADKARRHADDGQSLGLSRDLYDLIVSEINRMIERGNDYSFTSIEKPDRGWVFCPEYVGNKPLEITPTGWNTRIFLFGPNSEFRRDFAGDSNVGSESITAHPTEAEEHGSDPQADANESVERSGNNSQVYLKDTAAPQGTEPDPVQSSGQTQNRPPVIHLGTNLLTGDSVDWPLTIKGNPHLLIAGLPGMGKTTCLLNICAQMLQSGVRPILFSYHQDIDVKLQAIVDSVRFIDFQGLGFNPLQVIERTSRMAYLDVAGALRDIFVAIYPELGDIQGERIRKAIKESFLEQGWDDPAADLAHLPEPPFSRFVEILRADPKPDRGLKTLLSRLDELEDYGFFLSGPHQESLWEGDQPIVLRIHSTQNDNLQRAFASLIFYGLYKDMFRRGPQDRITHSVIFDEAHRAAQLELIPTMAKECRKFGISLVLASQEAKDFDVSLFSAIANYLVLRLVDADAKSLVRNVASSDQERTFIDKIKQLERFKALYFREGTKRAAMVSLTPSS